MRRVNVVIGTMAGVAAGALLGVLLAPDRGTETRKKISTKSKETSDFIKNKFDHIISRKGSKGKVPQMQEEDDMN
jgi:gas vesicle protein